MMAEGEFVIVPIGASSDGPSRAQPAASEGSADQADQPRSASRRTSLVYLVVTLLMAAAFSAMSFLKLASFSYGFDTAIFSNVLWRLAHGYDSVSALASFSHLSDHPSLLVLILVPLARIAGPWTVQMLFAFQALSVAMVSWSVWRFAYAKGLSPRLATAVYVVTLVGAGSWFAATGEFHISDLALGPLAGAATSGWLGRRRWAAPAAALAAAARVEMAIAVILLGWLLARWGRTSEGRTIALVGVGTGIGIVIIGAVAGGSGVGLVAHLGHLGATPSEMIRTVFQSPGSLLLPLRDTEMWVSLAFWLLSFGLVAPLLGARWLLPALPMVIIPIAGSWPAADLYVEHYWHLLLVFGAFAAVDGISRVRASPHTVMVLLGSSALIVWAVFGPLRPGLPPAWSVYPGNSGKADSQAAMTLVSRGDSVAVPTELVVALALRRELMIYPRPFSCRGTSTLLPRMGTPEEPPDVVIATPEWPPEGDRIWGVLETSYGIDRAVGRYTLWRLRNPALARRSMVSCVDGVAVNGQTTVGDPG